MLALFDTRMQMTWGVAAHLGSMRPTFQVPPNVKCRRIECLRCIMLYLPSDYGRAKRLLEYFALRLVNMARKHSNVEAAVYKKSLG